MICPHCSSADIKVIDSRAGKDGVSIRRRRECNQCGARFTTLEEIIRDGVVVVKRDGSIEDLNPVKLLKSLQKVLEKRPVEKERIHLLANDILRGLDTHYETEIPSLAIAEQVMEKLKKVDAVAYVRYASQYRPFEIQP